MRKFLSIIAGVLLCLNGCGRTQVALPTPTAPPDVQPLQPGNATRGEKLFQQTLIGTKPEPGCITCHSLQPGIVLVGPTLAGIATRSVTTIQQPDYTGEAENVEAYLHESIIAPNVYIAPGFAPDVMRPTFATELSPQEIADLVAFLLTLKG